MHRPGSTAGKAPLSLTTDYATSTGSPGVYLRRIAEAGFTHIHWCHQWNTDFLYVPAEIDRIASWMDEFGLGLTDLHGSAGIEKGWGSRLDYEREAGVDLVANRMHMTSRLGGDVCIMHLPRELSLPDTDSSDWERFYRSLDSLRPISKRTGVRIAIENGDFDPIENVLDRYDPEFVGLCYDCGHGNLAPDGLDRLDRNRNRLISVHLHDNDGSGDQHLLPFAGGVDWERLAEIVAASSYDKWVSMESAMGRMGIASEREFLAEAFERGSKLAGMIARAQKRDVAAK